MLGENVVTSINCLSELQAMISSLLECYARLLNLMDIR